MRNFPSSFRAANSGMLPGLAMALLCTPVTNAAVVVIEPDDFPNGTDLSNVSPYVNLSTTGGNPVYASTWAEYSAPNLETDGSINDRVFSASPDTNSQWWFWPDYWAIQEDPFNRFELAKDPGGLLIEFSKSVSWFSLLVADTSAGAGCQFPPIKWLIYDSAGSLIDGEGPNPGVDGWMSDSCGIGLDEPAYPFGTVQFWYSDIKYVVIGGESEALTIDRLTFSVPEPNSLALLGASLLGLGFARRRRKV
jgi:hypothetical protein